MRLLRFTFSVAVFCAVARWAPGVILLGPDDSTANSTNISTPGDNSGWQYEGEFGAYLGTPIAPYYFITAKHIGGYVGEPFTFHGQTFQTTEVDPDPNTDLQIWKVDHAFAFYAPLYHAENGEPGQELRIFGRGTQRGGEISLGGTVRGWAWGGQDYPEANDNRERWGGNIVSDIVDDGNGYWYFLHCNFDSPGLPNEAHLSVGDSGGGDFLFEDGLWRLASINYAVDDLFTAPDASTGFIAAIFDARGYYEENDDKTFTLITGDQNVPTSFYCTQISSRLDWIEGIIGGDYTQLPTQSFSDWQQGYFTPLQIQDATISGPNADPDGDGIPNLLEFAFNLDPTFAEPAVMTAGTGVRGLPLIRLEQVAASDTRITAEFVRRTAASGSGVTYAVQFTSSLVPGAVNWQTGGTEAVTAINPRWERVKVTDTVTVNAATPARFARVAVTSNATASAQRHPSARSAK